MDLRSVLNTSDNGDAKAKQPPVSQHQQPPPPHTQQHQPPTPSRPAQSPAGYGAYRDYPPGPHPQQSPGRPASRDHPPQGHPYPQASPYQSPGPYPSRTGPPPLQSVNSYHHDSRSPSASMPAPQPSPYRQPPTPSSGHSNSQGGYPFPTQSHHEMTSPVQRQQYPPHQQQQQPYQHQRQESYPQGVPPHSAGSYSQQQHSVPQTPPVASAGSHQFPHQRSQSNHSTPTPTSAQSQHPYGAPYHGSPVSATQPQPPHGYPRPPSQPPTPGGGPPLSHPPSARTSAHEASHSTSASSPYKQPQSPYQQRNAAPAAAPPASAQASSAQPSPLIPSHHPPQPLSQRSSTSHAAFDSPATEAHPRPQYLREREQSLSVSPKTRVNPLPTHADHERKLQEQQQLHEIARQQQQAQQQQIEAHQRQKLQQQQTRPDSMAIDEPNRTPAKRKLEDRDVSPQDLERKHARTSAPAAETNGQPSLGRSAMDKSKSPAAPRKKRIRRAIPPRWAQSVEILKGGLPKHPNFVLVKRVAHAPAPQRNGHRTTSTSKTRHSSRQTSPEASRSQAHTTPAAAPEPVGPRDMLGAWEPCLAGVKPQEELSRLVADFLFVNVINCQDFREITSLGIQFEIEAKLGTVIDRRTGHRVERGVASECLLEDTQNFKSSMSEENHRGFNDFLNKIVVDAHPKRNAGARVPVDYKHRREIDRFYELSPDLQNRLPACIRARFGGGKRPRVRVTHDQQSKELLGKIVKARVADIDLHLPTSVMDCRLSINLEMNWDGSVEELEGLAGGATQHERNKDRLSYSQGHYQVDLTQVTQASPQGPKKEHELEIELSPNILIDQGRRAASQQPHRYGELVEGLVDNIRMLARIAKE